jgi:tRNA (guanine37-N1)-methyltransferase
MFPGPIGQSLSGKALKKGLWSYNVVNIRDFGLTRHKKVDDSACGGGAGMVMRADVLGNALDFALQKYGQNQRIFYMSPKGRILKQEFAKEIIDTKNSKTGIIIVCGRFEGIDQRLITYYNIEEVSVGDYILSGGELAALVLVDACIRLLEGVVSTKESLEQDSFSMSNHMQGLLEYPVYTKPSVWRGLSVPEVLLSGHHQEITHWKMEQAKEITKNRRPDLWKIYDNKN